MTWDKHPGRFRRPFLNEEPGAVVFNPGTGPIPDATLEHAIANMDVFVKDLWAKDTAHVWTWRRPIPGYDDDFAKGSGDGDGRFAFIVNRSFTGQRHVIEMPGIDLANVRFLDGPHQTAIDFPRLYVDGSSWLWLYALNVCIPELDDEEPDELTQVRRELHEARETLRQNDLEMERHSSDFTTIAAVVDGWRAGKLPSYDALEAIRAIIG